MALDDTQRRWLDRHLALAATWPREAAPYVATMRIETGGRVRDVMLGDGSRMGRVVQIDHATAPLAEVFYGGQPGEAYEVEVGERVVEGVLIDRALVRWADGALVEVEGDDVCLRRGVGGWSAVEPRRPRLAPGPRRAGGAVAFAALDAEQRAAVEAPAGEAVVVSGEAGSGKTTVALHRLAWLRRRAEAAGRRCRALVVVPTASLGRLVEHQLERMGLLDVPVQTFDDWAWREAKRAFDDWPARRGRDASAGTIALKRHPALLAEVAAIAAGIAPGSRGRRAHLIELFGDSVRMGRVAAGLTGGALGETLEHTHVQFSDPAEVAWSHVDAARLATIDRRLIDDGTPMEDAGTADVEDAAVLFELDRVLAARDGRAPARPRRYDVLVVDEVQALTAVELRLLGRAVAPGGAVVAAGDAGQHFDDGVGFEGWHRVVEALLPTGRASRRVRLRASYRCPPALAAWARRWVDGTAADMAAGVAEGMPEAMASPMAPMPTEPTLIWLRVEHRCPLALRLIEALDALPAGCSAGVITRTPAAAAAWAALLDRGVAVRHAPGGDLRPGAGVAVLPVAWARGLEFDVVVIPDAGPGWADTLADRRALYVAATRATGSLLLATVGRWSPIIEAERRG